MAQNFPLTIETRFGPAVIAGQPDRVATLDFNGADDLLALGVQPVAIRYWYGNHEKSVWPWAAELLTTNPLVVQREIDLEALAATDPDVILAMWSGIDADMHTKLSQVAPVVAVPDGVGDYEMPWDARARLAGLATGRLGEAEVAISALNARFDSLQTANPHWQRRTASVAYLWDGRLGVYGSGDVRPQILANLGLMTPAAVDALVPEDGFAVDISGEILPDIDADVILWFTSQEDFAHILALPGRNVLQGGEVFVDDLLTGAFSHASLLSLPYVLDRLEPALNAAFADRDTPVDLTEGNNQ
ncbi:ABC transporter substrate-binding protein [Parasulfitobacter algicola]|uniref:ABC transporter substrate-binding protein n=1 Tax=Parasulfitobacter algicola TaxID=2614809 RepID=A0ABX2IXM9_9RHOB|nr:ABC transporter substrate-binding protein [Sulfitobacter algicola]NSX56936.1 ABC transporter substrate-binding protein [Sulfitobacter algicola]